MSYRLPIFPLHTVLFPGATLELRIFESRYKAMLKECMEGDRRFGVALIKRGEEVGGHAEPHRVGTVARIEKISPPARSGLPIEFVGERRFRIISLDRSLPYLTAQVEPFDDVESLPPPSDLIRHARHEARRFISVLLAARGVWSGSLKLPSEPMALSYFIGMMAAEAPQRSRQKVLEADSLTARLQAGIALIDEEAHRLAPAIMRSGPGQQESRFSAN